MNRGISRYSGIRKGRVRFLGNSGRLKMGPAKKKAVLKHHSEQPFFNIVVGLAPMTYNRILNYPCQANRVFKKIAYASIINICYDDKLKVYFLF